MGNDFPIQIIDSTGRELSRFRTTVVPRHGERVHFLPYGEGSQPRQPNGGVVMEVIYEYDTFGLHRVVVMLETPVVDTRGASPIAETRPRSRRKV